MIKYSLTDDKNYHAQVNCVLDLSDGNILVAGEDGLIKIIYKFDKKGVENKKENLPETYLEKMLDGDGYLANIEDVKESENGDIVCVECLGNIGIYKKSKLEINSNLDKESYKLKIVPNKITNDCFYYLNIVNESEVEIWGETGKKYKIKIT